MEGCQVILNWCLLQKVVSFEAGPVIMHRKMWDSENVLTKNNKGLVNKNWAFTVGELHWYNQHGKY